MRLTRLGASVLAADALVFFGALISGNNLLYLVAGAMAASILSLLAGALGGGHPQGRAGGAAA